MVSYWLEADVLFFVLSTPNGEKLGFFTFDFKATLCEGISFDLVGCLYCSVLKILDLVG